MHAILIVFRNEMLDHLRDRRSILIAMIYPLLGPLLLGLLFSFVGSGMRVDERAPLLVPVWHAESAPDLIRYFERQGATVEPLGATRRAWWREAGSRSRWCFRTGRPLTRARPPRCG